LPAFTDATPRDEAGGDELDLAGLLAAAEAIAAAGPMRQRRRAGAAASAARAVAGRAGARARWVRPASWHPPRDTHVFLSAPSDVVPNGERQIQMHGVIAIAAWESIWRCRRSPIVAGKR
jgi:hypothetical protein